MASVHLQSAFDFSPRPQTHQGIHSSLAESPRIRRPISQESLKIQPGGNFSPAPNHADSGHPLSAYPSSHPQPFHQYQPSGLSLPLPPPHQGYMSGLPNTTPPIPIWSSNTPIFDSRHSHAMIRTISHGHPMTSATEHTISSRYSSPHSATLPNDAPPSAGAYSIPPPSFNFQDPEQRHINPALFNQNSYPMSRSTSGASDAPHNVGHRLLTPHYEERHDRLNSSEQELRKVSDSLGRNRPFYSGTFTPNIDLLGHGLGLGVHPQPEGDYFSRGYSTEHFALSAERGETKPDIVGLHGDTEYERERAAQIMNNKKLLENVGLGAAGNSVSLFPHISGRA